MEPASRILRMSPRVIRNQSCRVVQTADSFERLRGGAPSGALLSPVVSALVLSNFPLFAVSVSEFAGICSLTFGFRRPTLAHNVPLRVAIQDCALLRTHPNPPFLLSQFSVFGFRCLASEEVESREDTYCCIESIST